MSLQDSLPKVPRRKRRQVDGRRLRSERTRHLIIEAYLDLLNLAPGTPTAAQIAARAGYSVRSIFERFSDLDALGLAAMDYALAVGQAEAVARDVDGDRPTRIRSHVETRAYATEKWLPLWRILIRTQDKMPDLKSRIALARQGNLERLKLMYRPELSTLEAPARAQLLVALVVLISFESWDLMRDYFGLSPEEARDVWRSAIDRMLPPTPPA
ncbi:MAG: TetR/AcrR family transcriptional regulator [Alphaproteobacteria bacterium]|nr:TetR/AcrR family transcriptional regulator [Alphaproteobacteria bacterium]